MDLSYKSFVTRNSEIARALGATISKMPPEPEDGRWAMHWSHMLVDGVDVSLHYNNSDKRIYASVAWPRQFDGQVVTALGYNEAGPKISIAIDKTPEKIAADIKRRLLPAAAPVYAKAVEQAKGHDEYEAKRKASLAKIAEACGGFVGNNGGRDYVRGLPSGWDIRYAHGDSVRVELDLSADDFADMVRARKAAKGDE